MLINSPGNIGNISGVKKKPKIGGGNSDFGAFFEADEVDSNSSISGNSAISSTSALFLLQEIDNGLTDKEGALEPKEKGEKLLEYLDNLRHDLLQGKISKSNLQEIEKVVATKNKEFIDPRIGEILAEIEIRAAVELAKYQ